MRGFSTKNKMSCFSYSLRKQRIKVPSALAEVGGKKRGRCRQFYIIAVITTWSLRKSIITSIM
jgi:hypothetical protein